MTESPAEDAYDSSDVGIEASENDVLDQHRSASDDEGQPVRRNPPLEADPADAADQDRDADADDEEYR